MNDMSNAGMAKSTVKTNFLRAHLMWLIVAAFLVIALIFIAPSVPALNSLIRTHGISGVTEAQTELYFSNPKTPISHQGVIEFTVANHENATIKYEYRILGSYSTNEQTSVLSTGMLSIASDQQKQVTYTVDPGLLVRASKITVELRFVRHDSTTTESNNLVQTIHFWTNGEVKK